MAKYRVIKFFTDLKDGGHPYKVGEEYPREGYKATKKRIAELAGSENKQKTPLIEEIVENEGGADASPEQDGTEAEDVDGTVSRVEELV